MNNSYTSSNPALLRPENEAPRLPVPLEGAFDPRASMQWRLAASRLHAYLHGFGYGERRSAEIVTRILLRVASDPRWASGRRVVALAMHALQEWLLEEANAPLGPGHARATVFAQARLLAVSPALAVTAPPLRGRWQSFPVVSRRAMVAAKRPTQRPLRLPWRLIRRHGR